MDSLTWDHVTCHVSYIQSMYMRVSLHMNCIYSPITTQNIDRQERIQLYDLSYNKVQASRILWRACEWRVSSCCSCIFEISYWVSLHIMLTHNNSAHETSTRHAIAHSNRNVVAALLHDSRQQEHHVSKKSKRTSEKKRARESNERAISEDTQEGGGLTAAAHPLYPLQSLFCWSFPPLSLRMPCDFLFTFSARNQIVLL